MSKFPFGQTCLSCGVNAKVVDNEQFAKFVYQSLARHGAGDWGDMCAEDKQLNEDALISGNARLFSAYQSIEGLPKIWIITEYDHSVTTVLYPEEY